MLPPLVGRPLGGWGFGGMGVGLQPPTSAAASVLFRGVFSTRGSFERLLLTQLAPLASLCPPPHPTYTLHHRIELAYIHIELSHSHGRTRALSHSLSSPARAALSRANIHPCPTLAVLRRLAAAAPAPASGRTTSLSVPPYPPDSHYRTLSRSPRPGRSSSPRFVPRSRV